MTATRTSQICQFNSSFACFAHLFFIFRYLADLLVLSTTWNDLFSSCVDDVSIRWKKFNFFFSPRKHWSPSLHTVCKCNDFLSEFLSNDGRNAKLHFQIKFLLRSTSCLLKLSIASHSEHISVCPDFASDQTYALPFCHQIKGNIENWKHECKVFCHL